MRKVYLHTYVAYASASFAAAALHNIFLTYYVDLYLNVYKLQPGWFYFGEFVYAVWNSFNDPLFGWILNSYKGSAKKKSRLSAIRYGGPMWCVALILFFVPWTDNVEKDPMSVGLHFVISLCLYDGMLSLVQLAHGSLLADITISSEDRAKCNMYASIFGSIGANSVFLSHLFWDKQELRTFRIYCFLVALVAFIAFEITAIGLDNNNSPAETEKEEESEDLKYEKHPPSLFQFAKQILKLKNFVLFVIFTLIQVFNCHFNSNFLSIFLEYFLGTERALIKSIILSGASIFPHVFVVLLADQIPKIGLYKVIKTLVTIKFALAFITFLSGKDSSWMIIAAYLLLNKVFSETICRHGNLVLADIVDEDYVVNTRAQSMSSAIFGANALFTKPGQSLAPVLGWTLLVQGQDVVTSGVSLSQTVPLASMFSMLVFVPMGCAVIQYVLWSQFTLKGSYLEGVKRVRSERESSEVV